MRVTPGYPCSLDAEPATLVDLLALIRLCRELGHTDAAIAGENFIQSIMKAVRLAKAQDHENESEAVNIHAFTVALAAGDE